MGYAIKRFLKGSKKTSIKKRNVITELCKKNYYGKIYDTRKYNGYLQYKKNGKWVFSHRERCLRKYKLDNIPNGFVIHHISGDILNNDYDNLIMIHTKDHFKIHNSKTLVIKNK